MQAIFDQGEENLQVWKTEMKSYEKGKRTKIPFGRSVPQVTHVTYEDIKAKEQLFNPVLQTYTHAEDHQRAEEGASYKRTHSLLNHLRNTAKYEKNFDIINLHSDDPSPPYQAPHKKSGPIRNAYNVINNQRLPEFYFQNKDLMLPVEREKRLIPSHQKEYDIVTNLYKEGNSERERSEMEQANAAITKQYWQTHTYDPVFGKFYDAKQEEEYQQRQKKAAIDHGKDAELKLPPSYVHREPFIADYSKPLPQTLKALDEKTKNAKSRFQKKYAVQNQYYQRNVEEDAKQEVIAKNKVHFGRILDQKVKQFDIITNTNYKNTRAEELFGKKPAIDSWDSYIKDVNDSLRIKNSRSAIKSQGFAT